MPFARDAIGQPAATKSTAAPRPKSLRQRDTAPGLTCLYRGPAECWPSGKRAQHKSQGRVTGGTKKPIARANDAPGSSQPGLVGPLRSDSAAALSRLSSLPET